MAIFSKPSCESLPEGLGQLGPLFIIYGFFKNMFQTTNQYLNIQEISCRFSSQSPGQQVMFVITRGYSTRYHIWVNCNISLYNLNYGHKRDNVPYSPMILEMENSEVPPIYPDLPFISHHFTQDLPMILPYLTSW